MAQTLAARSDSRTLFAGAFYAAIASDSADLLAQLDKARAYGARDSGFKSQAGQSQPLPTTRTSVEVR
jgi:hypothetical protein